MHIKILTNLYKAMGLFVGNEPSRHNLTGIYIQPRGKNALCVATNGRSMAAFLADEALVSYHDIPPAGVILPICNLARLKQEGENKVEREFLDADFGEAKKEWAFSYWGPMPRKVEYLPQIPGPYCKFWQPWPSDAEIESALLGMCPDSNPDSYPMTPGAPNRIVMNPKYLVQFKEAAQLISGKTEAELSGVEMFKVSEEQPLILRCYSAPNLVGMAMPMRTQTPVEQTARIPFWVRNQDAPAAPAPTPGQASDIKASPTPMQRVAMHREAVFMDKLRYRYAADSL